MGKGNGHSFSLDMVQNNEIKTRIGIYEYIIETILQYAFYPGN